MYQQFRVESEKLIEYLVETKTTSIKTKLAPITGVVLEKLSVPQLFKNIPKLYGI
jgi:hypothetical protein